MKIKNRGSLDQVDIVLEATMDELYKIRTMAGNLTNLETVFQNAKGEYDQLSSQKAQLESQKKSFNPVKLFSTYRSMRLLAAASKDLYKLTRSTSEKIRRQLLSVNRQDVQRVDYDDIPSDARISAIAVPLESQLDESTSSFFTEAAEFIASQVDLLPEGDPFADDKQVEESDTSTIGTEHGTTTDSATSDSGSRFSAASSPSSPSSRGSGNNYFIFNHSYVASRSAIQAPTLNHAGSNNQGSSVRR
ncbi:hypothetical protein K503DRAFT_557710 [Rhizopogon vinicolor AM-OR11-026]|uniref:Uncharacterized protein n=1 Tax=Rhizopogon vinicolor AM-OR11-026 TaxID=1314800 RepID=A0A1B7MKB2_9AGAM|nr:hypothetical protein K503DRAFT_557710 [Rhizopogon vinicolor AM-OR11-026]